MPAIRIVFLWHMHQPYYKDLVTGEYRLPWVRLHALKDYYGMVKLLDEFPGVHQTFNLVPSLIAQIQDYVAGTARDPFREIASRPAGDLNLAERAFAIQYLFQANPDRLIGRYPRYRELWQQFRPEPKLPPEELRRIAFRLHERDITDLQVLSQIAWMDEFFLTEPEIRDLIAKGHDFSHADQHLVVAKEREFLERVLPVYKSAAERGLIEISTSPYYHPILPLVCDTDAGALSHPGLRLPEKRFRHPEDAREQIVRGLLLHEQAFGLRPKGMWPSEGSVSNEALAVAHGAGIEWMASDEGVLGRSLSTSFFRDSGGFLDDSGAENLYRLFRWEREGAAMNVLFRDHSLSDLIGFVYSGMPAREAAQDLIRRVKQSAAPVLKKGKNAVVPIILDGENAWEFYPESGREFLRLLYDGIEKDSAFEALTVSETIAREPAPARLESIAPGSWINANFDVWIGAREDNLAWDYLSAARDFYDERVSRATQQQKGLAYEELLIAEGSDWNWWYGPEHHSANDAEFDELYRKHLSNVYQSLGASPPFVLSQPIATVPVESRFTPQSAYVHPTIDGKDIGYFDWLGAASFVAEHHASAMHGKTFVLDTGYAGIDETSLYCRIDFLEPATVWASGDTHLLVTIEAGSPGVIYRLEADLSGGRIGGWSLARQVRGRDSPPASEEFSQIAGHEMARTGDVGDLGIEVALDAIFECKLPLQLLQAPPSALLGVRFTLMRDTLPVDALPEQGFIELHVIPEDEMSAVPYAKA
ncbi:MAG TPA: glycoside hydrolase [Candidatus Angelobacter sp.]|nr:glycoside hydrolase [Candidatus Angelobacter sp.]